MGFAATKSVGISLELARLKARLGRVDEADLLCREVLRVCPGHVGALHLLGLLAAGKRRLPLGVALLNLAHDLQPNDPSILADMAILLQKRGMEREARDVHRRVLTLDPDDRAANEALARPPPPEDEDQRLETLMPRAFAHLKIVTRDQRHLVASEGLHGLVHVDIADFAALNRMPTRHWEIGDDDRIPVPNWSRYPAEWEDFAALHEERTRRGLFLVENVEVLVRRSAHHFDVFTDKGLLLERDYQIPAPQQPDPGGRVSLSINFPGFQEAIIGLRRDLSPTVIDEPAIFLNECFIFGHFLADILPKLSLIQRDAGLRVPPIYCPILLPYQRALIDLLGLGDLNFKEIDANLGDVFHFKRGFLPGHVPYPHAIKWIRDQYAAVQGLSERRDRRLFFSRANMTPDKRRLGNEEEIFAFLEQRGFERIFPSAMAVEEVARLVTEAEAIVSPVGSTETNCILARPGTLHIQLVSREYIEPAHIFWRTSDPLFAYFQLDFHRVLGEPRRDASGSVIDKPITIDPADVAAILDQAGILARNSGGG